VAYYGGLGEIAQGFCRTCAVNGGVYILGKTVVSLQRVDHAEVSASDVEAPSESPVRWTISLDGVPDSLSASVLVTSLEDLPSQLRPTNINPRDEHTMSCTVVVTDTPPSITISTQSDASTSAGATAPTQVPKAHNEPTDTTEVRESDSERPREAGSSPVTETAASSSQVPRAEPDDALVTFPPGSVPGGTLLRAVRALSSGPKSNSSPVGRCTCSIALLLPL